MQNIKSFGSEVITKSISPEDPSDTAYAVLRGGALKYREVFYPYIQAKSITLIKDWIPETLDKIVAKIYKES